MSGDSNEFTIVFYLGRFAFSKRTLVIVPTLCSRSKSSHVISGLASINPLLPGIVWPFRTPQSIFEHFSSLSTPFLVGFSRDSGTLDLIPVGNLRIIERYVRNYLKNVDSGDREDVLLSMLPILLHRIRM